MNCSSGLPRTPRIETPRAELKTLRHTVVLLVLLAGGAPVVAAPGYSARDLQEAQETVHDALAGRWYEIELIIFERLDVFDFNTVEKLVTPRAVAWPANLIEYQYPPAAPVPEEATDPGVTPQQIHTDLDALGSLCIGWPELMPALDVHPLLLPEQETEDETDLFPDTAAELATEAQDAGEEDTLALDADSLVGEESLAASDVGPDASTEANLEALPEVIEATLPPTPQELFQAALTQFEEELLAGALTWQDEQRDMITQVKYINRRQNLRPLLHYRWRQAVPERDQPQPIMLSFPEAASQPRLFGTVDVTLGRYLHTHIALNYTTTSLGWQPVATTTTGPTTQSNLSWQQTGYIRMQQSRRMRSDELHYLDHPKIGVLIKATPVQIPLPLIEQWLALKDLPAGAR